MRVMHSAMVWVVGLMVALTTVPTGVAHANNQEALLPDAQELRRIEAAADRGLRYLVEQQRDNGSWPTSNGSITGVNALCLLAFLGHGHTPDRGPYQDVVTKAIDYLLSTQDKRTGVFKGRGRGPMYSHGLATLALIEAYGCRPSPKMHKQIQRALDVIVKSQNREGGWRYNPVPHDADLSVTVVQIVALRAAVNARFEVPDKVLERALAYVKACEARNGGYTYQAGRGGAAPARTAAGILSMQLLGAFDEPHVASSLDYLVERGYRTSHQHFWYLSYYAMQAFFQAGGDYWSQWQEDVKTFLLNTQKADGSWDGHNEQSINGSARCYSTAMAAMCLEVYMHYLPAYQR